MSLKSTKTLAAAVLLIAVNTQVAFSQAEETTSKPVGDASPAKDASAAEPNSAPDAKPSRVYEGGVKGTAIRLEEGLSQIGLASDLIQESTLRIMKEATRKDTIVMRGPNVLPGGVVIPALGGSNGVMQFGELPIRREKLMAFLADSEQSIAALQSYVDALILPSDLSPDATQAYSELKATMQSTQDHLQKLKDLSAERKLANTKIAREALKIHDSMDVMQRQKAVIMQSALTLNPVQKE